MIKRGAYGHGLYFSDFPDVSLNYGSCLILCKVLFGQKGESAKSRNTPGLDSYYALPASSSGKYAIRVIFAVNQILPFAIYHFIESPNLPLAAVPHPIPVSASSLQLLPSTARSSTRQLSREERAGERRELRRSERQQLLRPQLSQLRANSAPNAGPGEASGAATITSSQGAANLLINPVMSLSGPPPPPIPSFGPLASQAVLSAMTGPHASQTGFDPAPQTGPSGTANQNPQAKFGPAPQTGSSGMANQDPQARFGTICKGQTFQASPTGANQGRIGTVNRSQTLQAGPSGANVNQGPVLVNDGTSMNQLGNHIIGKSKLMESSIKEVLKKHQEDLDKILTSDQSQSISSTSTPAAMSTGRALDSTTMASFAEAATGAALTACTSGSSQELMEKVMAELAKIERGQPADPQLIQRLRKYSEDEVKDSMIGVLLAVVDSNPPMVGKLNTEPPERLRLVPESQLKASSSNSQSADVSPSLSRMVRLETIRVRQGYQCHQEVLDEVLLVPQEQRTYRMNRLLEASQPGIRRVSQSLTVAGRPPSVGRESQSTNLLAVEVAGQNGQQQQGQDGQLQHGQNGQQQQSQNGQQQQGQNGGNSNGAIEEVVLLSDSDDNE